MLMFGSALLDAFEHCCWTGDCVTLVIVWPALVIWCSVTAHAAISCPAWQPGQRRCVHNGAEALTMACMSGLEAVLWLLIDAWLCSNDFTAAAAAAALASSSVRASRPPARTAVGSGA